jgi:hypothetical protein
MAAQEDKESERDILYFYISFVLPHGRASAAYKDNRGGIQQMFLQFFSDFSTIFL